MTEPNELSQLVQALNDQTEMLNKMALSLMALANAISEEYAQEEDQDQPRKVYMDGTPIQ